jgi:hypothetical protein
MSPSERTFLFPNQHGLSYKVTTRLSILTCLNQRTKKPRRLLQNLTSGVQSGRSVASRCRQRAPHPRMRHSSPKKQMQVTRGSRISAEELRGGSNFLLPRCRHGNAWFFGYFFFFAFFFALGTEITCRCNVTITGLTLPTATKFCPLYQDSSSSSSSSTSSSANCHIARPVLRFSYDTPRVFATPSLVPHSFLVITICFVVSIL